MLLLTGAPREVASPVTAHRAVQEAEHAKYFYDGHGNAAEPLQELMRLRFAATL